MSEGADGDMGKRKANGRKTVQKDTVIITLLNGSTIETMRNVSKVRGGQTKHYIPCACCQDFAWVNVKSDAFKASLCNGCWHDLTEEAKKDALSHLSESDGE